MLPIPSEFIQSIKDHFPIDGKKVLAAIREGAPRKSLLFNPLKHDYPKDSIPWNELASLQDQGKAHIIDPLYHAGCYYSQEPSSAIITYLIKQLDLEKKALVLDVCAAPGGKSLNILNTISHEAILVSNEINTKRNSVLQEVLEKWGRPNKIITQADPKDLSALESLFDMALIDAPCSGEGMFRKSELAINQWSKELINSCAGLQRDIILNIDKTIKEGGYLIYSTCTLNKRENEENAKYIEGLGYVEIDIPLPKSWCSRRGTHGHYFLPGISLGEGFYFCVFKKLGTLFQSQTKGKVIGHDFVENPFFKKPLLQINRDYFRVSDEIGGVLERMNQVKVKTAGTRMLISEHSRLKPAVEGVRAGLIDLPTIELPKTEVQKYLRGESLQSDIRGWVAIKYKHCILGPAKGTGKRLNNHYPKNWRIKRAI